MMNVCVCLQMISVPVVVIVHGSQEINAMATVIWDCAFSKPVSGVYMNKYTHISLVYMKYISQPHMFDDVIRTGYHLRCRTACPGS